MKFLVGCLVLVTIVFSAESISYEHHLELKANVFDLHWHVNTTEDRFYFKVVANTTGWVGVAFTTTVGAEDMKNYDIALGGVKNGNDTYLWDYWSSKEEKPSLDSKQDLNLTNAMESNGKTTIEFNRKADTGDNEKDTSFKNATIYLAWAIGKEDATNMMYFNKHADKAGGGRGHTNVGYNMYTKEEIKPPTTAPPTTKQAGSVIGPSIVALVLIQLGMQLIK